jgi:hypothetical protein
MKEDEIGEACGTNGEKRVLHRGFHWKLAVQLPLGRPRRRWEDNIELGLKEDGVVLARFV